MGTVDQVSPDGAGNKGPAELNYHIGDEHKEIRDGIVGEGQVLSEEDESRINEVAEDLNDNQEGNVGVPLAHQAGPQNHQQQEEEQQQPPGPIIRWERFLTVRTLKVLLVENDDSTRQVVSALLRNCSYEVTAVANGLQAWKILEDLTNHIDLVLTEVVMPCLSGIGLLSKIMSHKTCKNIPVIMMSSNDSMGTVFKCLSKGAVDFLVKPIRKNELKNLWQHVWRRYHSSSSSESGIQTQKIAESKSADDSDNYSGSNDDDNNGSIGLNVRDGSDNGSGTQSSWTKRAVEVDSPQPMSPSDQLAEPPDGTCTQFIHPKPETFCNDWVSMTANAECKGQKEHADDFMGKDLEIGVPRNPDAQYELYPTEQVSTKLTGTSMDKMPESNPKDEGALELDSNNVSDEPSTRAADLIGAIANSTDLQLVTRVMEAPHGFYNIAEGRDKTADGTMELPSLELSLKRLRSAGEGGTATHDDRNVLRRSDLSAFSRYHTSATSNQATTGYGGSCSPLDNSSEAVKTESTYNMISSSNAAPLKQHSNGSSDNNDMGSTTKNVFSKPVAYKEKTASTSAVKCIQPSAFHPMQFQSSDTQQVMQERVDGVRAAASIGQPGEIQCQVQVQHHHHHYHHHHLIHSIEQQQPPDHDDLSLKNMAAAAPQCGSSNMFAGPVEGKSENYSINGSNSGSNHGSNGQNGSSAVNTVRMNIEIANGNIDRSMAGSSNGSGSRCGSGVDQSRLAQREAALKKFRQKRKERNFEKKVRYQSRKRLAEQRPRVRGQFVRQSVQERRGQEADR